LEYYIVMRAAAISRDTNPVHERKNLASVLRAREVKLSTLDEKYWTVIGGGPIGAKAEELKAKTWAIEAAGFVPNPRVVLAMGFFEGFRERNGIEAALARGDSPERLSELVAETPFAGPELKAIRRLVKLFRRNIPGVPIAVRSSAHGDCRGTGIYESDFCFNFRNEEKMIGRLIRAIKSVLMSEFSESAIAFRKDMGLQGGMAVIIEPVFGQFVESRLDYSAKSETMFGPYYSGIAYTSTIAGPGYVQFVAGLPTCAVRGGGFVAMEKDESAREEDSFGERAFCKSLWGDERRVYLAFDEVHRWKEGEWLKNGRIVCRHARRDGAVGAKELFRRLRKLEHLLGGKQYVEWAARKRVGREPEFGILQIAGINPKTDFCEFIESERILLKSNYVIGSGQRDCEGVVLVMNPDEIPLLGQYNRNHRGYAVVYHGRLISSSWHRERLEYSDINNASALIELAGQQHVGSLASHFGGMADLTGKLLMATSDVRSDLLHKIEACGGCVDAPLGLNAYAARVRVTASERRQKGIVELLPPVSGQETNS
jgi:hypothetical protein